MKSQNDPTMPARRKLLVAGAGIAAATLIPHVSAASPSSQVDSSRQTNTLLLWANVDLGNWKFLPSVWACRT